MKKESEYVFARWCMDFGWEPEREGSNAYWVKGKDRLSLVQLQKVFKDWKDAHK